MTTDKLTIDDEDLYVLEDGSYEWEDKAFTGVACEYRADGSIVNETEYVNGLQEGPARCYYPSGKLYSETHWVKNSLHGQARVWYENGQLEQDAVYEHAILVLEQKWDKSGKLVKTFQLTEDHPLFKTLEAFRLI